ncbi:MAG TPA: ribonuclease P protein component [Candidatus Acidoferrum sp.]|nr:ribonuclease P protein component [Candidatus Acidoferrum sp.]
MSGLAPNGSLKAFSPGKRARFTGAMRLLRHSDFERVYKQGRRHPAAHMTVFYLLRQPAGGLRIGLTVGKVLGGAVERNRIKRRLREAVRLHWPVVSMPVDVVINPRKSVLKIEFSGLCNELSRAFTVIQKSLERSIT